MADKTTNFGLNLPLGSEIVDQEMYNDNFVTLDTEVAKRITAVNGVRADDKGEAFINEVPFARQIVSDEQQQSSEEYLFRTTGGNASLDDGDATLVGIYGRSVHTGIVSEVFQMTVTPAARPEPEEGEDPDEPITATIDKATFIAYVENPASITVQLVYTDMWSANPSLYGITVVGTPIAGDTITVLYVRPDRGTITSSDPTKFISTGWNLYNHTAGYARVKKYSSQYNFMIGGTYESLKYSATIDGEQQSISVSQSKFSIPDDGYIWVTGGNATTTCIYMTWSDWTSGHEGTWQPYTESVVDFSYDAATAFPYGMCQVGPIADEIDFSLQRMIRRIERVSYNAATIETLISSGVPYDADNDYIYYVLDEPVIKEISVTNIYTANDHGEEMLDGDIAPLVLTLYGENLVEKLRHDIPEQIAEMQETISNMNTGVFVVDLDDVTNTSGSYTHTTTVTGMTSDLKCVKLECSNPLIFLAPVSIVSGSNSVTLTCSNVSGTSSVRASFLAVGNGNPLSSSEYSALDARIGSLSDLDTTDKSSIVAAINDIPEIVSNTNGLAYKYPNGVMICIKTVTASVNCNLAWGSMYESDVISFGNWAASFTGYPSVFVNPVRASSEVACWPEIVGGYSQTSAGESRMYRPTAASGGIRLHIMGIGSWK